MKVEFECIVCGRTAIARVNEEETRSSQGPLETLRDCPICQMETIWIESRSE